MAAALGWRVVDNELVEQVAARAGPAARARGGAGGARPDLRRTAGPHAGGRLTRGLLTPETAGAVVEMPEADLVKITETVVAEIAAQGRVVLVGRAAPAVLSPERTRST